jgi:hypothetical protein
MPKRVAQTCECYKIDHCPTVTAIEVFAGGASILRERAKPFCGGARRDASPGNADLEPATSGV